MIEWTAVWTIVVALAIFAVAMDLCDAIYRTVRRAVKNHRENKVRRMKAIMDRLELEN